MTPIGEQTNERLLYGAITAAMVALSAADMFVPLGTAVWVIYLFPIALSLFGLRAKVPLALALLATVLVGLGYVFGAPGIDQHIALINRVLGVATCWIVAITGYFFIRGKLAVRKEKWLQTAEVGLSQTIMGEQRLDELGENVLRFLAGYLDAQAGVLFIKSDGTFRRYAAFGVPAEANIPDTLVPGDGLLGEAIRNSRGFSLADVPDGYLYFGSGLGQAKPRHLLISPTVSDGEVNAVLEIGFMKPVPDIYSELVERLSEPLSIAVRSANYRDRLRELLEETRRQSEELQAQSEDLRSANEELEEQSRSLQESQSRLEIQQAELEQTNAQLEEHAQILETQRNDLARAQLALQRQTSDLEQASRYKSEFLANMSHELRTPLNSLLILARLLAENRSDSLSAEEVQYAQTIETSGNDLLILINDILDISKIEAGHLEIQPATVKIGSLVDKIGAGFIGAASEKSLQITTEVAPGVPSEIETDPQRLEQILKNFLSNAVKFTEAGEVALSVGIAPEGGVAFSVRDTGIGIPSEQQKVIFEAFRQADGSINRKFGGTGLGLSISRELARLIHGTIHVDSAPGRGSTFTLVIPETYQGSVAQDLGAKSNGADAAPPPKPASNTPERSKFIEDDRERLSGDSRIMLVVEDDPAFARILCDLAREVGFSCVITPTADEGVVAARQYIPHAVILDMSLPDHSGLSVLDRLKRDVRTRHIPVHVVSASDYTQTALALGAVSYMLKPVKREELVQAMERLEVRLAQKMRRVLIVEDDPTQLKSIGLLLASRDVEAVGVGSAAEALRELKTKTYDCIVLDLSLPDVHGFDFLEQLNREESVSFPPVIVYTGRDLSPEEELKLRKYSKSIIVKGAKSPERLLDEVTLFLHQVVSELPQQQQKLLAKSLSRDAAIEGRHILVVEDDVRNVYALTSILEPHGAFVTIARNGREAIQALEGALQDGAKPVDLVLMDIMMPEMDGLTATREIRSRPRWRSLPIITLTAKAMPHDQEQCLAAGANDYLAKPLNVDKLLSLVRVWMPR